MQFETIRYEVEDRIATITFNRPDKLNAVSPLMVRELKSAWAAVESDEPAAEETAETETAAEAAEDES